MLGLCAVLIPLLGVTVYVSMDRIAALADGFFAVEPGYHRVHYFTWTNLKGGVISITIGVLVYLLFVRKVLMKKNAYVDLWPAFLNLEDGIYRPCCCRCCPLSGPWRPAR